MPHETTLPGVPSSVPAARRFVQSVLTDLDGGVLAWTAALLVSELVTNAMLHARTDITVTVTVDRDGPVRLAVQDGSARAPQVRGYGSEATTGRGLHLVQDLASRWGVDASAAGKTVWVELDREDAPEAGADTRPDVAGPAAGRTRPGPRSAPGSGSARAA